MNCPWDITEVVSGHAPGADTLGERFAKENNIPVKLFPAAWKKLGRAAGPVRNKAMADYAEALVAFLYPHSKGTKSMIGFAHKKDMPIMTVYIDTGDCVVENDFPVLIDEVFE